MILLNKIDENTVPFGRSIQFKSGNNDKPLLIDDRYGNNIVAMNTDASIRRKYDRFNKVIKTTEVIFR